MLPIARRLQTGASQGTPPWIFNIEYFTLDIYLLFNHQQGKYHCWGNQNPLMIF